MAKLDPLGLDERSVPIELDPALYGFADKDLDRECDLYPLMSPHSAHCCKSNAWDGCGGTLMECNVLWMRITTPRPHKHARRTDT